jgi:uncharacterized protein
MPFYSLYVSKKINTFKILFVFIGFICFSFTPTDFTPFSKSSLLWKIEGNNIPKGSYLFGTMHLIEKDYFIFPDKLQKIISKSDQIILEIAGLPTQAESMKMVTLQEGTFFDFFTTKENDSILNWAKTALKMPEETFKGLITKMKPFVIVQMATQLKFVGKTESYEIEIQKIAESNKIETKGLETALQQLAIFDNLTKDEQAEMVMEVIRDSKEPIDLLKKMEQVYQRQNIDSLYMLINQDKGILSKKEDEFLLKRNHNWVPQIKESIAFKKCFIAVGAGHLGGPNGLIRLLQKEGYTLTPIQL